jgi:hypothetical protein
MTPTCFVLLHCVYRGPVIGSLKALLGLGPSLFAAVDHVLLAPDAAELLLLLALAPAVIVGLGSGRRVLLPAVPVVMLLSVSQLTTCIHCSRCKPCSAKCTLFTEEGHAASI